MRLAAYTGVLAARVNAEKQEEQPGGGMPQQRRAHRGAATDDPHLLGKLAGEGWVEHTTVEEE